MSNTSASLSNHACSLSGVEMRSLSEVEMRSLSEVEMRSLSVVEMNKIKINTERESDYERLHVHIKMCKWKLLYGEYN